MPANGREIIQRYESQNQAADGHFQRCERMVPYLAPSRQGIRHEGSSSLETTYDSTTQLAAELMAHFIAGHIINPGQRWQTYSMEPHENLEPDELDEINEWLEECNDRTLRRAATSMFYAEGAEALIDWGGFGTGFLIIEENPQPVNTTIRGFRGFNVLAERTGRFLIQDGVDGRVDTAWRRFMMTSRNIKTRWEKIGSLPENVKQALDKGDMDKQFKIIHAIYPRPKEDQLYGGGAKGMPWASCWVEHESKHLIFESGYRIFPAAAPRYHRTPSEIFGRGRGDVAFPDTWSLNAAKRMGLEDHALKIRPPIFHTHNSVMHGLKLIPGGPNSINAHGKPIKDSIMPFDTGSRPEITNIREEELRKTIRQIFYVDHILALMEVNKSEMTAYEYAQKLGLLFKLIGPVYARADWELLHKVSDVMFDLQLEGRDFSPPPDAIYNTNGEIKVTYQNPLARAQRSGDAEALLLAINDLAPLGQSKPEVFDWFDLDTIAPDVMFDRGMRSKWIKNRKAVDAIRAERAKMDIQQNKMDQLEQLAGAAGKATSALELLQGGKQ